MKPKNKQEKLNCPDIQNLLARKSTENLTDQESALLLDHLQHCEHCTAYQTILTKVESTLQPSSEESLIPDPAIQQNIRNRIKAFTTVQPSPVRRKAAWTSIRAILNFKIPVYQAVLAMAVLFAVFLFASKGPETRRSVQAKPNSLSVAQIQEQAASHDVSDSIRIMDPRKIGKSVAEDSVLIKFTVTVL